MQSDSYLAPLPLDDDARREPPRDNPHVVAGSSILSASSGEHAVRGRQRFWTPLRVVMLFAVVFLAFGFFSKAPCLETNHPDPPSEPSLQWNGSQYYKACYTDAIPLYGAHGLDRGELPYRYEWKDGEGNPRYMEYPVVTGMFQWGAMKVTKVWEAADSKISWIGPVEIIKYFSVVALAMALSWLVAVWAAYRLAARRPLDSLFMAASPLVIFQIFTNFDAMAVASSVGSMLAWAKRRPILAGVLMGLGVAMKFYPLLILGAYLVLGIRVRKLLPVLITAGSAAVTWLAINAPIMLLYPKGWNEFYEMSSTRGANPESIYTIAQVLFGMAPLDGPLGFRETPDNLNMVAAGLFLAGCVAVLVIGLTAKHTPRIAQLSFLIIAFFLLTNKVWSPQYSLWLVPLALLAIPRARLLLPWMIFDALLWIAHMSYFHGSDNMGVTSETFLTLVLVRDAMVLALCAWVIVEIYRPGLDRVKRSHRDDPNGLDPLAGLLAITTDDPRYVGFDEQAELGTGPATGSAERDRREFEGAQV